MSPFQLLDLGRNQRPNSEFSFKGMLYPLGKLRTHPCRIILFVFYLIVPENFFNVFLEEEFIIVEIWNISLILFLWPRDSPPYLSVAVVMGPQAIPDIGVSSFCIKDVFKITKIIEPTGCFNQNHVSLVFDDYKLSLQWKKKSFLLGKLYHPVAKQIHHRYRQASVPTSLGSGKFFPWQATLAFTPPHPKYECSMQSLFANFQKLGQVVTLPKDHQPSWKWWFSSLKKKN